MDESNSTAGICVCLKCFRFLIDLSFEFFSLNVGVKKSLPEFESDLSSAQEILMVTVEWPHISSLGLNASTTRSSHDLSMPLSLLKI